MRDEGEGRKERKGRVREKEERTRKSHKFLTSFYITCNERGNVVRMKRRPAVTQPWVLWSIGIPAISTPLIHLPGKYSMDLLY